MGWQQRTLLLHQASFHWWETEMAAVVVAGEPMLKADGV
jgi:hypothetical protein